VSDEALSFSDRGPATQVGNQPADENAINVSSIAIDDLVTRENIEKVDFIKMDIEGAEANALVGAQKTIAKFRPKLAICVYHKKDDFYSIPTLINQICPDYSFHLDHYTIHREETVLYAAPKDRLSLNAG
jgi:hypothetical protein